MNNSSLYGRSWGEPQLKPSQGFSYLPNVIQEEHSQNSRDTHIQDTSPNILSNLVKQTMAPSYMANRMSFMLLNEFQDTENLDYEQFQQKIQKLTSDRVVSYMPNFNLEHEYYDHVVNDPELHEADKKNILASINTKIKKFSNAQRVDSIRRYHEKKNKRKSPTYIRYKIRQDLAGQRIRHKGKFVKNQRIDLKKAAEMLMRGKIKRARIEGADGQDED